MKTLKQQALIAFLITTITLSSFAYEPSEEICERCNSCSTGLVTAGMAILSVASVMRVFRIAPGLARANGVGKPAMVTLSVIYIVASGVAGGVAGYLIAIPVDYLRQCIFSGN